jgi:Right handed beta helix region
MSRHAPVRPIAGRPLPRALVLVVAFALGAGACGDADPTGTASLPPSRGTPTPVQPSPSNGASPTSGAEPTARTVAYEGDATGATDVTADLTAAIEALPDGSTLTFRPDGRYRLDCTVIVSERVGLTIDGQGATFLAPAPPCDTNGIWSFRGGRGHVIRDVTIVGEHPRPGSYEPPLEFQMGVEVAGVVGMEVADVTVRNVYGDCVYVGYETYGGSLAWAEDVWVHGLDCAGNGRQGIAVTAGRNVLVERSTFADQAYVVFDIEPDAPPNGVDGVTIRENVVSGRVEDRFLSIGGTGDVRNVVVEGNEVRDGENQGIWTSIEPLGGHRRRNVVIRDNVGEGVFTENRTAVFTVRGTDEATIRDNRQPLFAIPPLFADIDDSCAIVIAGNVSTGVIVDRSVPGPCP